MNDLKITISRSYTRKINLGNYESEDFFANYSEEILSSTKEKEVKEVSEKLYNLARRDVEEAVQRSVSKFGNVDPETRKQLEQTDWKLQEKFNKLKELARTGINYEGSMEDYQEVCEKIPQANYIINELKKEYKRSDAYKSTLQPRTKNVM